jgi:hypothetical protein
MRSVINKGVTSAEKDDAVAQKGVLSCLMGDSGLGAGLGIVEELGRMKKRA